MAKLEGKVALITGAAVGLGEGIAEVYAKYGAKMCMVDLSPEVEKTADRLRKEYGADIITYVGNVADKAQMKEAAAKTAECSAKSTCAAATLVSAVWLPSRSSPMRCGTSTLMSTSRASGTPARL